MASAIYREFHPPTGVTHCAEAHFLHPPSAGAPPQLLVARATRLEAYRLSFGSNDGSTGSSSTSTSIAAATPTNYDACRLELVAAWSLYGVVEDMAVLPAAGRRPATAAAAAAVGGGGPAAGVRDALLLSFRDAKVSVVAWCPETHDLRTLSLHAFDRPPPIGGAAPKPAAADGAAGAADADARNNSSTNSATNATGGSTSFPDLRRGRRDFVYPPRVLADPQGRCAACVFFGNQLALFPPAAPTGLVSAASAAAAADALDAALLGGGGAGAAGAAAGAAAPITSSSSSPSLSDLPSPSAALGPAYVLDLSAPGGGAVGGAAGAAGGAPAPPSSAAAAAPLVAGDVRDACFLHGYSEPVLLLLHEDPPPTWAARYGRRRDTCAVTALSLNLRRRRHPAIWRARGLPSDAYALSPAPGGGALVLCQNLVLYRAQGASAALAVNSNAFPSPQQPPRLPLPVHYAAAANPMLAGGPAAAAAAVAAGDAAASAAASRWARQWATAVAPGSASACARGAERAEGVEAEADAARVTWLSPHAALLALRSGQLLQLGLHFGRAAAGGGGGGGGGSGPARLSAVAVGGASAASCACTLTGELLFLGSWTGDSLLVRYGREGAGAFAPPAAAAAAAAAATPAAAVAGTPQQQARPPLEGAPDSKRRRQSMHLASMEMGGGLEGAVVKAEEEEEEQEEGGGAAGGSGGAAAAATPASAAKVVKPEDAGDAAVVVDDDDDIYRGAVGRSSSAHLPEAVAEAAAAAAAAAAQQQQQAAATAAAQAAALTDRYRFKVMDSLTCIGPVRDMVVAELALGLTGTLPGAGGGAAGAAGPDAGAGAAARPPQSLVAAVGEDHSGALAVLRRGVLADVVTRVPLPLARGAWAVRWRPAGEPPQQQHHHAFLLLTLASSAAASSAAAAAAGGRTMVLDARGEQLRELRGPDAAFVADAPTLAAGAMLGGTAVVQVTPRGARLLEGPSLAPSPPQDVPASAFAGVGSDEEVTVVAAAVEDPYVLLRLSTGACVLLRAGGSESGGGARTLAPVPESAAALLDAPSADVNARVSAAALYLDGSGWMAAAAGLPAASSSPRVFLFVARLDGRLEGYALPPAAAAAAREEQGGGGSGIGAGRPDASSSSFPRSPVFFEDEFVIGHDVAGGPERDPSLREQYEELDLDVEVPLVSDLRLDCFPASSGSAAGVAAAERPLLLACLSDGSLLAYQAYRLPRAAAGEEEEKEKEEEGQEGGGDGDGGDGAGPLTAAAALPKRSRRFAFKRLPLDTLGHEDPALPGPDSEAAAYDESDPGRLLPRLVRFDGLVAPGPAAGAAAATAQGGVAYSGVFVCGARPLWLVASRGGLVPHPMYRDAPVSGMTAFHNVNCPHGFVLCKAPSLSAAPAAASSAAAAADAADLRICQLPAQARLDTPWLCHKLPLRATPARLTWCPEARVLAVLACRLGPHRPHLPEEAGGDPFSSLMYAAADATARSAGREDVWELRLIRPPSSGAAAAAAAAAAALAGGAGEGGAAAAAAAAAHAPWSAKPAWSYALLPGEEATALANVRLRDMGKGATPAACPEEAFVAVGAASLFGEDYPAMGRLLLFQVGRGGGGDGQGEEDEASPPGRVPSASASSSLRGRLALWREFPGAVSSVESVRSSYLLLGIGSRVEVHYLRSGQLVKAAFVDAPSLPASLSVVKDFVLVGDATTGPLFLRYKDAARSLELLSSDYDLVDGCCAEFLPNASKLGLVVGDARGNLVVYAYDASDPESWAGKRLLRRGAIHTGALPTRLARLRMAPPDGANRQALLVGNRDGGVGLLASLWGEAGGDGGDALSARLRSLQQELALRLPHAAGLNPRAFRGRTRADPASLGGGRQWSRPLAPQDNGVSHGDLVLRYAALDLRTQACVADAIGLVGGREQVLSDLRALAQATAFL